MPAEQRVITAGFVALGLGVLIALAFFFGFIGRDPVVPTIDRIMEDLYPAYKRAEENRNYPAWSESAQDIVKALEDGGRNLITTNLQAKATDNIKDARRIHTLITDGTIDKVAKGEFPFDGAFYSNEAHRSLSGLAAVLEEDTGVLRKARSLSRKVEDALKYAREGSGQPLPTPPAFEVKDKMPGIDPNPILAFDARAFSVLALDPALLTAALRTKNPGGRATSPRLYWNQTFPGGTIPKDLMELRVQLTSFADLSARLRPLIEGVEERAGGTDAAKKLYDKALDKLSTGLPVEVAQQLNDNRAPFLNGKVILQLVEAENELFNLPRDRLEGLAAAFKLKFP